MPERRERHFAGKVHAFNAGFEAVKGLAYQAIGSLDADLSFVAHYFAFLLAESRRTGALGLVGTPFGDDSMYDYRFVSIEHVSGACQLFRRECFEEIGGYVPMKSGGVDHVAVITARMKGWRTRTFTERIRDHHRRWLGAAGSSGAATGTGRWTTRSAATPGGLPDDLSDDASVPRPRRAEPVRRLSRRRVSTRASSRFSGAGGLPPPRTDAPAAIDVRRQPSRGRAA